MSCEIGRMNSGGQSVWNTSSLQKPVVFLSIATARFFCFFQRSACLLALMPRLNRKHVAVLFLLCYLFAFLYFFARAPEIPDVDAPIKTKRLPRCSFIVDYS